MTPRRRKLLLAAGGFLAVALPLGVAYRQIVWLPQQKLSDRDFLDRASQAELIEVSERVLSLPVGDPHDACIYIHGAGDVASVPALLRAMRRFGEPEGDGATCTVFHCVDALKRVTGHDEGLSPRAWTTWWETTGSRLPRSAFPPRPVYPPPPPLGPASEPAAPLPAPEAPPTMLRAGWAPKPCAVLDRGAGTDHTCVRKSEGSVWCWGGERQPRRVPIASPPMPILALGSGVVELVAGGDRTCARRVDGGVWCWKWSGIARPAPVPEMGKNVVELSLGGGRECVRDPSALWCWIGRRDDWIGFPLTRAGASGAPRTTRVLELGAEVAQVALSDGHTCARGRGGTLWCWGSNSRGQLGLGTKKDTSTPTLVAALGNEVAEVTVVRERSCARKTDGTVWCWGRNRGGELGDGSKADRHAPVQVAALGSAVVEVELGESHGCARKDDGTVWCWGGNKSGTVGDGTTVDRATPVQVQGLSGAVELAAGTRHTCARVEDGGIWCWGRNAEGQLGDGTTIDRAAPARAQLPCP